MFLSDVVENCHKTLLSKNSKLALAYLVSRGITLEEIQRFKIGYFGRSTPNIIPQNDEEKKFNGWLGPKGYYIAHRIVFPIYDELGNIKGIETRGLDSKISKVLLPKFQEGLKDQLAHLPESTIRYKKFYLDKYKYSAYFFGIPQNLKEIWERKEIFLTEGIFDAITLLKIKPNCVSSLTANINKEQVAWLKRYAERVILFFDSDVKGKEATKKVKELLDIEGIKVHPITLKGKDLNESAATLGIKEVGNIINSKMEYFI